MTAERSCLCLPVKTIKYLEPAANLQDGWCNESADLCNLIIMVFTPLE